MQNFMYMDLNTLLIIINLTIMGLSLFFILRTIRNYKSSMEMMRQINDLLEKIDKYEKSKK